MNTKETLKKSSLASLLMSLVIIVAIQTTSIQLLETPKPISLFQIPQGMKLKFLHQDPMVVLIENFITSEQAEELQKLAKPKMQPSMVGVIKAYQSGTRTSQSAMFTRSEYPIIQALEEKVSKITGYPIDHIEPIQVVWYKKNQEFKPHFDYFESKEYQKNGTQRIITFFVYLNDLEPHAGGETLFPELNLKIAPKKNAAVLWYDVNQSGLVDPQTLHGGLPVKRGEKWGINIWVHDKPYASTRVK